MKEKVFWKIPGIYKADAEGVYQEIRDIGETVTPKEIVNYARCNPVSELHKCFEWNDSIAAERFRETQAQNILRVIVVESPREEDPPVRLFSITEGGHSEYKPTRKIVVNHDEYDDLRERAIAELKAFRLKYKTVCELEEIFSMIDEL